MPVPVSEILYLNFIFLYLTVPFVCVKSEAIFGHYVFTYFITDFRLIVRAYK